jgi:hypothetical protein
MAQTKIVANSRVIYNDARDMLTSGQIANWRMTTYETDLTVNKKFTFDELNSFMDLVDDGMNENYVPDMIKRDIFDKLARGIIDQDKLWFVMIDSCVMCTESVEQIVKDLRIELAVESYIVLIKNNINTIENQYKLANENDQRYSNIDFSLLKMNIEFLDGKYLDGDSYMFDESFHDQVITTNLYHENQLLITAEDELLAANNGKWHPIFRNEANDIAQLSLLEDYMSYVQDCNGLMITRDNGLISKIKNKQQTNEFLSFYNF